MLLDPCVHCNSDVLIVGSEEIGQSGNVKYYHEWVECSECDRKVMIETNNKLDQEFSKQRLYKAWNSGE